MTGSAGQQRVDAGFFDRFRVPELQPIEQSRIAEILDITDTLAKQTGAVIKKLRQVKAGLLHDLLTFGLDEQGRLRDPISHPEQFQNSVAGLLPAEWTSPRLEAILTGVDAGHSPNCPSISAGPGEWGVLKVSAVTNEGFVPSENKRIEHKSDIDELCEVKLGDLLMTRCNTPELVGAAALVEDLPSRLMLCDKTFRLHVDSTRDEPRFLVHILRMPSVRRQIEINATGSSGSMKNISQDNIRSLVVPRPPVEEQRLIAKRIDSLAERIATEQSQLLKLRSLKRGLSEDLLTGRVRVKVCEIQCR